MKKSDTPAEHSLHDSPKGFSSLQSRFETYRRQKALERDAKKSLEGKKRRERIAAEEKEKSSSEKKKPAKHARLKKSQKDMSLNELAKRNERLRKKRKRKLRNKQLLRKYLDQAGYEYANESKIIKNIFRIIIAICLFFSLIALIVASVGQPGVGKSLLFLAGIWTGVFGGLFVLAWVVLYVFLDLKIFKRTAELEDVLPDYLQLASANISAGMPIDRALWFAVRPRFGILAKEIEHVAKSTFSGQDLKVALVEFAGKYDSTVLKRSINLLIEGMEAGGELAELLNKIAINIQETKILKKEMAANVMTYAIFIGFASVVAAPILYGLSGQLLIIIQQIMGLLAENTAGSASSGPGLMSFDISGESIALKDYTIFSVVTLFSTSLFSGFIISTIRKGSIKDGFRFIPILVLATIALYFLARWLLGLLLGGIIDI